MQHPYAPQQQQPSTQRPSPQQFFPFEQELFNEILRAMVHLVAKDMHSDLLDKLALLPESHPSIIHELRRYNDMNEEKIRRREHLPTAPAASKPTYRKSDVDLAWRRFNTEKGTRRVRFSMCPQKPSPPTKFWNPAYF